MFSIHAPLELRRPVHISIHRPMAHRQGQYQSHVSIPLARQDISLRPVISIPAHKATSRPLYDGFNPRNPSCVYFGLAFQSAGASHAFASPMFQSAIPKTLDDTCPVSIH
jgi:hypothetical protein